MGEFFLCFFFLTILKVNSQLVIETSNGKVEGAIGVSRNGKQFISFLGIPYGKIYARFQESVFSDKWNETLKADKFGPTCVQFNQRGTAINGEENCLYLNIYTPNKFRKLFNYPVMVFIHGGAFSTGASNLYGPNYILDEDVILVTLNYRVGVLGFLNGDDKEVPGNVGLKDMILGLRWVQNNIRNFGGNQKKVTVFGESAGGASVSYLVVSPLSKGLFRNAIVQSGSAFNSWAFTRDHLTDFKIFADLNNCTNKEITNTMKCLREAPLETLLMNSKDNDFLLFRGLKTLPRQPIRPSLENCQNCDNSTKFLPETPRELYKQGNIQRVRLMIGANKDEAAVFTTLGGFEKQEEINKLFESGKWNELLPFMLNYNLTAADKENVTKKINQFYFGGEIPQSSQVHEMLNDRNFFIGIRENSLEHSKYAKTFLYSFDRFGINSLIKNFGVPSTRSDGKFVPTHFDELIYLMSPLRLANVTNSEEDTLFSVQMTKLWTSFAKYGEPKDIWDEEQEWIMLEKNKENVHWFHLDDTTRNIEESLQFVKRMNFWKDLNLSEN